MPVSIEQLIVASTAAEIEAEVLSLCASNGLSTSSWQSGSVIRTIIAILSQEIATKSLVEVEIARGGLGDLSSAEWAKLWAYTIYNVIFVPAAPATGVVTLTNESGTQYDLDPGDLIVAHSVTGKTYRNQDAISILAGSVLVPTELVDVAIQSDETGTANDAAPGEITSLVTALVGVSVTNPAAVLGADEETTAALVLRTRSKLGSLSPNGPKEAYNYVAQTPELSVTSTPITRSRTVADPVTGEVSLYIATAGGAPTAPDVAVVQAAIEELAEPWCVESTAIAASEIVIPITYRVWIRSSITSLQVTSAIAIALSTYLATIQVGGVLVPPDTGAVYVEALTYVIHTALPGIERVLVTVPAADVVVAPNEVPVLGAITPTVTFL